MEADWLTLALGGRWTGRSGLASCPVPGHGRGRGDLNPSLAIGIGERRPVVFHCHGGCSSEDVLAALTDLQLWPPGPDAKRAGFHRSGLGARCKRDAALLGVDHRSDAARRLWQAGQPIAGTPAEVYLARRSVLDAALGTLALRFLPGSDHLCRSEHALPALLAALTNGAGAIMAVQRTWLTADGRMADHTPRRTTTGPLRGAAVRLARPDRILGLAEGVETALAAQTLFGMPVWAACGLHYGDIDLPDTVSDLILFADHDPPGIRAARAAAERLAARGLSVRIEAPIAEGEEWNDYLIRNRADHAERG